MKKVLITGINGFVGCHLARHLLTFNEFEIIGTYRTEGNLSNLSDIKESLTLKQLDMMDAQAVLDLVSIEKPDYLYHLAAQASPAISFQSPKETIINNTLTELNILEALKIQDLKTTRVLIVTSSEIYGEVTPSDIPVDEDTPLRPVSPYSVSKITQDYLAYQYFLTYHLDIVRVRPFNHIGPGQKEGFVVADFAKQIAEIEKNGKEAVLHVGNLEAKRDFTDVRDMVKAYHLALATGVRGEVYNLGSGTSRKIADMLEILLSGSAQKIEIRTDTTRFRPIDVPEIVCDYQKFQSLTNWKPEIPFEKTMQDILDYWRRIV